MIEFIEDDSSKTGQVRIKVLGVGGGGGNAVRHMMDDNLGGVEFLIANTDAQVLNEYPQETVLQLGKGVTKGLGAGGDPAVGRDSADEDREVIRESLATTEMLFITAGMGGGTGTGAAPIVAEIARELGILTVAVVTKPFKFEGKRRGKVAQTGVEELSAHVDSLIVIPNNKLIEELGKDKQFVDAFGAANNVLLGAVQGISELITRKGLINIDFADVSAIMRNKGMAVMGTGTATGANAAREAAEKAIECPLLEDTNWAGAEGVLVNVTAGRSFSMGDMYEIGNIIEEHASEDADVIVGNVIDETLDDEVKVTIVATGFGDRLRAQTEPQVKLVETKRDGSSDFPAMDVPPGLRHRDNSLATSFDGIPDVELMDIPAFLRRQAD